MTTNSKKPPFFIVGCPRSGTTLLQTLLDSHPNIAIPPESHLFARFSRVLGHYGNLRVASNLKVFVSDLLNDECIKPWGLDVSVQMFCERLQEYTVRGVISHLFELFAEREGKKRWGDKTPQHGLFVKEIGRVFPEAKFIHVIRDGRDVAQSLGKLWFGSKSIYGLAHQWKEYLQSFQDFKKSLNERDFVELRYEDLVRRPQLEVERILKFLGESSLPVATDVPNSKRKEFYINQAPHHRTLAQPISERKVGAFKKVFTQREIEIFEAIAQDMLKAYGYSLQGLGKTDITFGSRLLFLAQDNYLRFQGKLSNLSFLKQEIQRRWRNVSRPMRKKAVCG